jgi:hypothetical protein
MRDIVLGSGLPDSFQLGDSQAIGEGILGVDNDGQAIKGDWQFNIVNIMGFT